MRSGYHGSWNKRRQRVKLSKIFRKNARNTELPELQNDEYQTLLMGLSSKDEDTVRLHTNIIVNHKLTQNQYNRIIQQFPNIIDYI